MSNVTFSPSVLRGEVRVPSSKSAGHRAMLCAALAEGTSTLTPVDLSRDMEATLCAIRALGAESTVSPAEHSVTVVPGSPPPCAEIDCGESGSTLRFLIPICAALGMETRFTGCGLLPQRPIGVYTELLPRHGVSCETEGGLPLRITGRLEAGRFALPGNISSQFITGLLLALPLLSGDSEIVLTTRLESAGYIDMTRQAMRDFGVSVQPTETGWLVPGNQTYHARDYAVEGDWSQAAFFLAAGALGGEIAIHGLRRDSVQGDRAAETLFADFGAAVRWDGDVLRVKGGSLRGMEIDAAQIPDLVPVLAAVAALAEGETHIDNAARLRIKESDRLAAITRGLTALGAEITELAGGLRIRGVPSLRGGQAEGCNDHRIVMALAMAALCAKGAVSVTDAQSIQKSYSAFYEDYNRLGGLADVRMG